MSHFGVLCPPTPGHLNPMFALGRVLIRRSHRVTLFQVSDLRSQAEREGLEFSSIGEQDLAGAISQLGRLSGFSALRFTIDCARHLEQMVFRNAPDAVRQVGCDLLLVDQNEPAGGSVAEHLGLPFVSVCAALPLNREPAIPPPFVPWSYRDDAWAKWRNWLGYAAADRLLKPLTAVLNEQRQRWGLSSLRSPNDSFSRLAQLCTLPRELDFPRCNLPSCFHYLGPFLDGRRSPTPFPWERLDDRPLIYASFGTLQNRREHLFRTVASACAEMDVQLVLSMGGGAQAPSDTLPGQPIVVHYAPQLELLARSAVAVTHAGLNTVLESLERAVPVVAVPVTNDQPAIAARVRWAGVGDMIAMRCFSASRLRGVLQRVLHSVAYHRQAGYLQRSIEQSGGVERAADIVEQVVRTGGPAER